MNNSVSGSQKSSEKTPLKIVSFLLSKKEHSHKPTASVGIPRLPYRFPIIGNIFDVDHKRFTLNEVDNIRKYYPVYERNVIKNRVIMVGSSEAATEVSDDEIWAKAMTGPLRSMRLLIGNGLLTVSNSNPLWKWGRNVLNPGFVAQSMRVYHETMFEVVQEMLNYWKIQGNVSVTDSMNHLTLEIVARCAFSYHIGEFSENAHHIHFSKALAESLEWSAQSNVSLPVIGDLLLKWKKRKVNRYNDYVHKIVKDIVHERTLDKSVRHNDLLDLMLHNPDPETGKYLPEENMVDQALTFLFAGHETTASTLAFALWHLASQPDVQEKFYEQMQLVGSSDAIAYESIAKNRIVRSLLEEVLRMYPPVPAYVRIAKKDTTVSGYPVKRGDHALVLTQAAQTDKAVWGDSAEVFQPDRYYKNKPKGFYKPFGLGKRNCIGRQFALHEMILVIGEIVKNFHITLDDPHADLELYERGTLRPAPYKIRVTQRNSSHLGMQNEMETAV